MWVYTLVGSLAHSFCTHTDQEVINCSCGEEEKEFAWVWGSKEDGGQAGSVVLGADHRHISFNPEYSSGTAAVRGSTPLPPGHRHYWELKMTSAVYGTDIMVGVCTAKFDLSHAIHRFCSLLGRDQESWGYSYTGAVQHAGKFKRYGQRWGKGSIVGLLLDTWRGTLEFFHNRKPLGVAFGGLQNKELYPIVTSTSAHSGMKLVASCALPVSLQFLASEVIHRNLVDNMKIKPNDLPLPPRLLNFVENNYWPFLRSVGKGKDQDTSKEPVWSPGSPKRPHDDDFAGQRRAKRVRRLYTSSLFSNLELGDLNYPISSSSSDSSSDSGSAASPTSPDERDEEKERLLSFPSGHRHSIHFPGNRFMSLPTLTSENPSSRHLAESIAHTSRSSVASSSTSNPSASTSSTSESTISSSSTPNTSSSSTPATSSSSTPATSSSSTPATSCSSTPTSSSSSSTKSSLASSNDP